MVSRISKKEEFDCTRQFECPYVIAEEELNTEVKKKKEEINRLNSEIKNLRDKIEGAIDETQKKAVLQEIATSMEIKEKNSKISELQQEIHKAKTEIALKEQQLSSYKEESKNWIDNYESNERLRESISKTKINQQKLDDLNNQIKLKEDDLQKLTDFFNETKHDSDILVERYNVDVERLNELRGEKRSLHRELIQLRGNIDLLKKRKYQLPKERPTVRTISEMSNKSFFGKIKGVFSKR